MTTPLFSIYKQGENQVTATLLAVLQRLSFLNVDRVLGALLGETGFKLVTFENQPKSKDGTPDARVGARRFVWVETKTERGVVDLGQIRRHLKGISDSDFLLLLTPDETCPGGLPDEVVWSNFNILADAIEEILKDADDPPSEKEAFILRELNLMLENRGLINSTVTRVLIVAARDAWPIYANGELSAYISHPRPFRASATHIAFYAGGKIQPLVPKIKLTLDELTLTQDGISNLEGEQKALAEDLLASIAKHPKRLYQGFTGKVLFLSGPEDGETVKLVGPIANNSEDKNGKRVPFTYGAPRYVTLESLKAASTTSQLERC